MKRKKNSIFFWKKAVACMAGILILILIVLSCRDYIIKEGKAPYLSMKEFLPQIQALEEMSQNGIYEKMMLDLQQTEQEYVTVGVVKKLLSYYTLEEQDVIDAYKKDSWYMGLDDWNTILLAIVRTYGGEELYAVELTFLGDKMSVTDVEGNALEEGQILTDQGIKEAVYWNTDAYLYSRVLTVCFNEKILSVISSVKEAGVLHNVYLADISEEGVHFFTEQYHMRYYMPKEEYTPGSIVDLSFEKGTVKVQEKDNQIIHGKLLQVSDDGIEIEGHGIFKPEENMKVYRLYGQLTSMGNKDLRIGYSFTDFVLSDGLVAACLMIKEEDMDSIRVLLKNTDFKGRYHENFQAVCDQDYEVIYYENGVEKRRESKKAGESFGLQASDLESSSMRIKLLPKVLSANIRVESINRSQGIPEYRGTIEIAGSKEGLLVINEVLLEDYLCKVVPSEMPASYPKEALMAQAVSARTYAYGKMLRTGLPDLGAHVDDSAGFQVYNNIKEQPETVEAVKATHNTIAVYNGEPISMYYYSTSCGAGTNTGIWHGNEETPPYLSPRMIEGEKRGAISELTPETLADETVFQEWIRQKDPAHFESEEGWYRWTYEVAELDSEHMCSNLQKRYEQNPKLILTKNKEGDFISQPISKLGRIENIEVIKRLPGGVADELLITGSENQIKVISELNIRYVLSDGKSKVRRLSGDEADASSSIPSAYMVMDLIKEEGVLTGYRITGGGFGHGVGMSQNGAKNMALQGMSCEEILTFFYPGIELKTLQAGE